MNWIDTYRLLMHLPQWGQQVFNLMPLSEGGASQQKSGFHLSLRPSLKGIKKKSQLPANLCKSYLCTRIIHTEALLLLECVFRVV